VLDQAVIAAVAEVLIRVAAGPVLQLQLDRQIAELADGFRV
jgi:hypothetical protein